MVGQLQPRRAKFRIFSRSLSLQYALAWLKQQRSSRNIIFKAKRCENIHHRARIWIFIHIRNKRNIMVLCCATVAEPFYPLPFNHINITSVTLHSIIWHHPSALYIYPQSTHIWVCLAYAICMKRNIARRMVMSATIAGGWHRNTHQHTHSTHTHTQRNSNKYKYNTYQQTTEKKNKKNVVGGYAKNNIKVRTTAFVWRRRECDMPCIYSLTRA